MIPLNTAPGTEIVCVDDSGRDTGGYPSPIVRGSIYTLEKWTFSPSFQEHFIYVQGIPDVAIGRRRFRLLDKRFEHLLTSTPVEITEDVR